MKDININEFDLNLIKDKPFKMHIMGERNTGKTTLIENILNNISIKDIYLINYKPDYYGKYINNNIKYYDDYYNEDNLKKYINDISLIIFDTTNSHKYLFSDSEILKQLFNDPNKSIIIAYLIPLPLPNFIKNNLDFSIIFQMYFTYTMKRFYELYVINKIDFKLFTLIFLLRKRKIKLNRKINSY
jgi:GTPase SAR1 family protein